LKPGSRTAVVIALGTTQTIAWGSTYYLPAILARPMGAEFGVPASLVFGMFSVALLLAGIGGPYVGRWIDRSGGRGMLAASNLVLGAGLAVMAWAPGVAWLWVAWLILGAGMSMGLYEAAFSALASAYGHEARAPITGITLIAGFASTVAWPLSGLLEAEAGWRTACLAWAAIHIVVCMPLNLWRIPAGRHAVPLAPPAPTTDALPPKGGSTRPMVLLGYVFAVTWFTSTAMAAHLPAMLQLAGASAAAAIAAASLVGPAQVAARFFEFTLMRRTHPLLSARLATLAHPVGAVALLAFGAPVAALFTLIHGGGNGVLTIAKGTLPLAIFGPAGYGLRQGLLSGPARIGQAAAPLAFGLALDGLGPDALILTALLGLSAYGAMIALGRSTTRGSP
jgi:MFS family permease